MEYTLAVAGVPVCQVLYTRHASEICNYSANVLGATKSCYNTQRCT